jgi:hypothetical protein
MKVTQKLLKEMIKELVEESKNSKGKTIDNQVGIIQNTLKNMSLLVSELESKLDNIEMVDGKIIPTQKESYNDNEILNMQITITLKDEIVEDEDEDEDEDTVENIINDAKKIIDDISGDVKLILDGKPYREDEFIYIDVYSF